MGREVQSQQVSYTVEQLLAVNPYNPDILPDLENYVNEQVSSQTYSVDANLCLLRLYQFEPERMSIQIVERILVKALMAMPASDFSLCLFLIPERVQMEEQFKTLIVLSHYLEQGSASSGMKQRRHLLEVVPEHGIILNPQGGILRSKTGKAVNYSNESSVKDSDVQFFGGLNCLMALHKSTDQMEWLGLLEGFEQAIQAYAVHVLSLTCQKVPRSVLAEAINIEGLSLDKFLEHQVANSGWILEKGHGKGQLIVLAHNEFNHPELKKNTADSVPLEHITRIFPILG